MTIPEEYIPIYNDAAEDVRNPMDTYLQHITVSKQDFQQWIRFFHLLGRKGICNLCHVHLSVGAIQDVVDLGKVTFLNTTKQIPEVIKKYGGYGVDANGDGIADPYDIEDAMYSAANYLANSGAADGNMKKQFSITTEVKNTSKMSFGILMNLKRFELKLEA